MKLRGGRGVCSIRPGLPTRSSARLPHSEAQTRRETCKIWCFRPIARTLTFSPAAPRASSIPARSRTAGRPSDTGHRTPRRGRCVRPAHVTCAPTSAVRRCALMSRGAPPPPPPRGAEGPAGPWDLCPLRSAENQAEWRGASVLPSAGSAATSLRSPREPCPVFAMEADLPFSEASAASTCGHWQALPGDPFDEGPGTRAWRTAS
ncbi:uncharacterized protein LOC144301718 [Canis aureus]